MNIRKFSINKACILLGILLLLAVGAVSAAIYLLTGNITAVGYVFLFSVFVLLCVICFVALIRWKLVMFSDSFCGQMDDMLSGDMFSGLLYCADCGSKLTFHRKADEPAEKHNYVCGNYRGNTSNCTMHYIRNVVVERIVLENLKEVIHYVSNYEDEFVRMVMDADVRQKNRELAQKKKKLAEIQKRIGELDTIFQRIYEDNIIGKLSDERFMKMSKGYEEEQHTLQAEADIIQNELQQEEKKFSRSSVSLPASNC